MRILEHQQTIAFQTKQKNILTKINNKIAQKKPQNKDGQLKSVARDLLQEMIAQKLGGAFDEQRAFCL